MKRVLLSLPNNCYVSRPPASGCSGSLVPASRNTPATTICSDRRTTANGCIFHRVWA